MAGPQTNGSVIGHPQQKGQPLASGDVIPLYYTIAQMADAIPAWGNAPRLRDRELRTFWPSEGFLASAITSMAMRYAGLDWSLEGPPRMVTHYQDVLQGCEFGKGWTTMLLKMCLDLFTQDNGAFLEIVRADDSETSPVVSMNHLDAARCLRTGIPETPVIYTDINNKPHLLKWYQVVTREEMPSPDERAHGMQYCALTRILRFSQIMRDIAVLKHEKVSGRFTRKIWLVGGVQSKAINDALEQNQAAAQAAGLTRFVKHAVLGALDPTATVSTAAIDLAALPDDFDEDTAMRWYITLLALAFGTDYQEFAPMPGHGIGSGNQAKVQQLKSRGKGPRLFTEQMQHMMNFYGILPRSVRFIMGETDVAAEMEVTALRKERALEREILVRSGQITTEVARQMAVDFGDLDPRYLLYMREQDATGEASATTTLPGQPTTPPTKVGKPGPDGPPQGAGAVTTTPANNNADRSKPPSQSQKVNPQ